MDSQFRIRRLSKEDGSAMYRLIKENRDHLLLYFPITSASVTSLGSAKQYVKTKFHTEEQAKGYYRIVEEIATSRLIAYALIKNIDPTVPKGEIAYFTDKRFTGRGIMTDLVQYICRMAFTELDFHKLYLLIDEHNIPSWRVAEKSGFQQEGLLRDEYRTGAGGLVNSRHYGLLKPDWERIHAG